MFIAKYTAADGIVEEIQIKDFKEIRKLFDDILEITGTKNAEIIVRYADDIATINEDYEPDDSDSDRYALASAGRGTEEDYEH